MGWVSREKGTTDKWVARVEDSGLTARSRGIAGEGKNLIIRKANSMFQKVGCWMEVVKVEGRGRRGGGVESVGAEMDLDCAKVRGHGGCRVRLASRRIISAGGRERGREIIGGGEGGCETGEGMARRAEGLLEVAGLRGTWDRACGMRLWRGSWGSGWGRGRGAGTSGAGRGWGGGNRGGSLGKREDGRRGSWEEDGGGMRVEGMAAQRS